MFVLCSTALLGLALLAAPIEAAPQRTPLPTCEAGTRHVELDADSTARQTPQVCIRPELSLTLLFDTKLARVEVAGRERFRRVTMADDALTLVASESLSDGERVPVTVYFQDNAVPASVTFELVVHPSEAERQVEVTRHARTLASYQQGEQQARAEARQCLEEKARLQSECAGQVGLTGLIAQGLLGEQGIPSRDISKTIVAHPANTLALREAHTYRSGTQREVGEQPGVRLVVEMTLWNKSAQPWTPAGAMLVGPRHAELKPLGVWPLEPIPPGKQGRIVVELEAAESEARGPFTLKLWSQEDVTRSERFDGVTFP